MGRPVSAGPPSQPAARPLDRVVELRAELWRRHALLGSMDRVEPGYDVAAQEILALTADFLAVQREQSRLPPRRSWLAMPRLTAAGRVRT